MNDTPMKGTPAALADELERLCLEAETITQTQVRQEVWEEIRLLAERNCEAICVALRERACCYGGPMTDNCKKGGICHKARPVPIKDAKIPILDALNEPCPHCGKKPIDGLVLS